MRWQEGASVAIKEEQRRTDEEREALLLGFLTFSSGRTAESAERRMRRKYRKLRRKHGLGDE